MDRPTRESKATFWTRVEREGRHDAAKAVEAELLAAGMFKRKVQASLVQRFQPLDGTRTVAHATPDSWACGRVDAKKLVSKLERHDRDVEWAHDHPDRPPDEAPTPGARLMLVMHREKPVLFAKEWAKSVARIEQREASCRQARRQKVYDRRQAKLRREDAERQRIEDERRRAEDEARRAQERQKRAERKERLAREAAEEGERERVRLAQEAERKRQEQERCERARQARQEEERRRREEAELRELARLVQVVPAGTEDSEVL